jgi:hypothetical protein
MKIRMHNDNEHASRCPLLMGEATHYNCRSRIWQNGNVVSDLYNLHLNVYMLKSMVQAGEPPTWSLYLALD